MFRFFGKLPEASDVRSERGRQLLHLGRQPISLLSRPATARAAETKDQCVPVCNFEPTSDSASLLTDDLGVGANEVLCDTVMDPLQSKNPDNYLLGSSTPHRWRQEAQSRRFGIAYWHYRKNKSGGGDDQHLSQAKFESCAQMVKPDTMLDTEGMGLELECLSSFMSISRNHRMINEYVERKREDCYEPKQRQRIISLPNPTPETKRIGKLIDVDFERAKIQQFVAQVPESLLEPITHR
jgi:hypothetical protein